MKQALVILVLKWLLGITRDQWEQVCSWVADAAVAFTEGKVKNVWVREHIFTKWPLMKPHVVDALVGMAVGLLKKMQT